MTRDESIAAMRCLVDILEENPLVPLPCFLEDTAKPIKLYCTKPEHWLAVIAAFGQYVRFDELYDYSPDWLVVSPLPYLQIYGYKAMFHRVVVAKRDVPAHEEPVFNWIFRPAAVTA